MDGASSAATVLQLIQVATQVSVALGQYVVSVKNAQASCDKLIKHISIIISAAMSAKDILDTSQSSHSSGCDTLLTEWFADNGHPAQCMKEFDDLLSLLTTNSNGGMKWSAKLMWPLKERKIKAAIKTFDQHSAYFQLFLSVVNSKAVKQIGETQDKVRDMVSGIEHGVKAIATDRAHEVELTKSEQLNATEAQQLNAVLRWFNAFDCTVKHEVTLRQRQGQTCGWFFRVQQFLDWRMALIRFIWLNGKPGAGKSVLAAAVIEELSASLMSGETLAYFYCDFGNPRSTSAKDVMCSLVVQLLRNSRVNWLSLFPELKERMDRGADPPASLDILSDLLIRASRLHERPMVVIDALDECSDLPDLLHTLSELNDGRLRLLVTSRTELIIKETFSGLPSIGLHDMSDAIQADMSLRIKSELETVRILKLLPGDMKDEILNLLLKKADGMFRWVHCQLDRLSHCRSAGDIRKVLDTLPIGLFETYERILMAIEEKEFDGAVASRALMWLVTALRPLTLSQLGEALIIELGRATPNDDIALMRDVDILDICGSLVSFDERSGYVLLSHFSVKEYLCSSPPVAISKPLEKYFIDPSIANRQLAALSIQSIISYYNATNYEIQRSRRLVEYALASGFLHIGRICEAEESILPLLLELQEQVFINSSEHGDTALSHHSASEARWTIIMARWLIAIPDPALHIVIRFGPPWLLRQYLAQHPLKVIELHNPLTYAAQFGDIYHATMLLDKGLDINGKGAFLDQRDRVSCVLPLTAAAMARDNSHKDSMMTLFLERGSNIPIDTIHAVVGSSDGLTDNTPIIHKLMHHGADPNALDKSGNSALHASLSVYCFGHPNCNCATIVPMLVGAGCKPETLNHDRKSPLHLAAKNGHVQAIRFFIDIGAALPADIIHDAVQAPKSRQTVTSLLLSAGADIAVLPGSGGSALHTVLKPRCHPSEDSELKPRACCEVAQLLVVAGCKADVANFAGETPLNLAVVNGHLPALRVFMGVGTQLPADIIHSAARSHNPEMLRFVLHRGADASLLTDRGDSALHVLFSYPCLIEGTHCNCGELAQILLEAGCSCESVNHTGESPLHLAIRNHHDLPSVFHVLANFTGGAPSPVVDIIHALAGVGVSQPHFKVGRSKTTVYLRHYGGEFNSLSSSGDTALHIFLKLRNCRNKECRCAEVARILAEHGCHSKNHAGESPLFLAVQNYHLPVVDLLVGKGARVSDEIIHAAFATTGKSWQRPPGVAPVVKMLLQYRVDYNTSDLHGDTPIHTLLRKLCPLDCDCLNTVLLLVAAGYDPKSLGDDGKSIVQIAAENAHMSTVQYLLDLGVEFTHDLIHTVARCHKHSESLTVIQSLLQRGGRPDMLTPSGDTLLHSLARSPCPRSHQIVNYLETVDRLCQLGKFDLDLPNIRGETALHLAAREDNLALLRHLLDLGCALPADILHFAVERIQPNLEVIKFLIDRGASAESRNHRGDTLLHSLMRSTMWSVEDAHADVVHYVVALDVCDINGLDAFGKAPLHYAAENGLSPYVQLLLDKGARIPTDIMHSVVHSPRSNSISIIQMYLQEGAPLDLACGKNGNTLLHAFIIRTGASDPAHINPAITRYVMEIQGCNIHSLNLRGESPIFLAFKHHNEMAAEYLLSRGAQVPEGIVHTVLQYRRHGANHERLVTLILRHGGTIHSLNDEGGNALHSLLRGRVWGNDGRDLGMTKFLILHGCDIDARDFDGRTPFHYAVRNNNLAVVHFLIDKGAQFPDDILHDALANHNEQSFHAIFRLLSERGASISARTAGGDTTLHAVLRESVCRSPTAYLCMTRLLIDKGRELNVLNSFGESPLHLAVQVGYISIVRLLLDKGAKLYQGVIHSAIKTTKSASFRPILKMLIDGEFGDQTIFLERESHGLLHALCQQTFETECMHRAQVLQEFGLCVEKHVNTEDNKGYTPLGIVLNKEWPSPLLVSYLIDIGAKFSCVNYLHLDNLRWACELSWYPDAVKAYYAMLGRQSINLGGVREVQSVLACRFNLPPRVVNRILEAAGYWVCSSVTYRNVEFTYRQPKVWLSLPWLSSSASDVKPRRMVITYKMRDGRPSRPFLYQTKVSVSNGHQDAIPGLLPIRSRNSRLEVTNLIETAVWDRHDDPRKINGFSLDDLAHDDTLCFEGDMDIDPDDAEIELEFLRIDMYYAVSY